MKKFSIINPAFVASVAGVQAVGPDSVADLLVWLEADTGVSETGGLVDSWTDQKNSHVFSNTGLNRPSYNATGFNGLPSIVGSGNQWLDCPDSILSGTNPAVTCFVVLETAVLSTYHCVWSLYKTASYDLYSFYLNPGANAAQFGHKLSTEPYTIGKSVLANNEKAVWHVTHPNSGFTAGQGNPQPNFQIYKNGLSTNAVVDNAHPSSPNAVFDNTEKMSILGSGSAGLYLPGKISALLLYGRLLSGPEMTTIHDYLNSKWGPMS